MKEPVNSFGCFFVMTFTTPPTASEPQTREAGPRSTSMRSIMPGGGMKTEVGLKPLSIMAPLTFWRRPSTMMSV